jgi:MATE family multidrug resistance protein
MKWKPLRQEIRPLTNLAVPIVAGSLGLMILSLTDSLMIGHLGVTSLAAVSLTTTFLVLVQSATFGFLMPGGILIAQAHGKQDKANAVSILRHSLLVALVAATVSAILIAFCFPLTRLLNQPTAVVEVARPYWMWMAASVVPSVLFQTLKQFYDSTERSWIACGLMGIGVFANVPINWVLIFGHFSFPALGITGAGLGSFLAMCICFGTLAIHLFCSRSMKIYRGRRSPLSISVFAQQVREGFPVGMQFFLEGGATSIAGILMGWLGTTALAANQIVFSVAGILYMLPLGMASAVSIRMAQAYGSGEYLRLRRIGYAANGIVVAWMALITVGLFMTGKAIAQSFVADTQVVNLSSTMFLVVGMMQICDGVQSVSLGALRGILDSRWATIVTLISYWLLALPLGYVFAFQFGLGASGIWLGFACGLFIAASLLFWRMHHQTFRLASQSASSDYFTNDNS